LGNEFAIEFKSSTSFQEQHLKGLRALKEEKLIKNYYLVSRDPVKRNVDGINVVNFQAFFKLIWSL
jgi:tRNA(Glu) U13 pseudouridine synthase TruD